MAHEIGSSDSLFSVKITPWHGLGKVIADAPSIEEAKVLSGLDWEVNCEPLLCADGTSAGVRAVRRSLDGRVLGIVGNQWQPLQNSEMFDWFEPFIASGVATLETAGSLRDGERVWVLAKLAIDAQEIVKGDSILKYIMVANGHDGTLSVRPGMTDIRVVCANTLQAAQSSKASKLLRLRHGKNVKQALDMCREVLNVATQEFEATAEQYRFLASKSIDEKALKAYVKKVVGVGENETEISTRKANIIEKVFDNIFKGYGNDMPGVSGTWWAAYNGVNEYLNYDKGNNASNRLNNLWFGEDGKLDMNALKWATEYALAV